jgi:hypothetical protein
MVSNDWKTLEMTNDSSIPAEMFRWWWWLGGWFVGSITSFESRLCLVLSSLVYCTSVDGRWLLDGGYSTQCTIDLRFDSWHDNVSCIVVARSSSSIVHDCFQRNLWEDFSLLKKMREIVNSALGTVPLIKLDRAVSRATHWPTIMTKAIVFI